VSSVVKCTPRKCASKLNHSPINELIFTMVREPTCFLVIWSLSEKGTLNSPVGFLR